MILSGETIRERGIFSPFSERVSRPGHLISYGCGFGGYDIRLGKRFIIPPGAGLSFDSIYKTVRVMRESSIDIDPLLSLRDDVIDAGDISDGERHATVLGQYKHWRRFALGSDWKLILSSGTFLLGESMESIVVPNDCMGLCFGKSTYARYGIVVNITPLEPGWRGILTIEISNISCTTNASLYIGHGIAQIVFITLDRVSSGYTGSYQNQAGATISPVQAS